MARPARQKLADFSRQCTSQPEGFAISTTKPPLCAQCDDLSVVPDNDEAGFRVVEYGRSRKVVLPDSLKHEIEGTKLQRELRRRGIGQHTIEKALHAHVRVNTYRKIVSAIEEYKRQNLNRKCQTKQATPQEIFARIECLVAAARASKGIGGPSA